MTESVSEGVRNCNRNDTMDELAFLKEQYNRLRESHLQLQKINERLEEKLLFVIENSNSVIDQLSLELTAQKAKCKELEALNDALIKKSEGYRKDCLLAVSLLHTSPDNFKKVKYSELPNSIKDCLNEANPDLDIGKNGNSRPASFSLMTFPPTAAYATCMDDATESVPIDMVATALEKNLTKIAEVSSE